MLVEGRWRVSPQISFHSTQSKSSLRNATEERKVSIQLTACDRIFGSCAWLVCDSEFPWLFYTSRSVYDPKSADQSASREKWCRHERLRPTHLLLHISNAAHAVGTTRAGMQARDHYCNSRAVTFLGSGFALARCVERPKTNSWDRSHSDTNPVGTRPPKETRAESEQLPLPLSVSVKAPLSVLPCGGRP